MEIDFSNLKKIDDIVKKLEYIDKKINCSKRWLNISEASEYLGYSKDHLHKLKTEHFELGKHYHKQAGRILFDKIELDTWVTSNSISSNKIVDNILKEVL